ncbi:TlpA family protein disulfide reductase [Roseibium sp.]|uniref:TlpA family protein disulfide reductase n=1 Tax=Roseibium sp. TaxID=1936156 RepID=UPI003A9716FB
MVKLQRRDFLAGAGAMVLSGPASAGVDADFAAVGLARPPVAIKAPTLDVPDLNGTLHRVEDYLGKVVLVSFWATWCPPCRKEMPSLARLNRAMPSDSFAVLAVNVGDKDERISDFLAQIDHEGLPVLLDRNSTLPSQWFIRGLPVSYVLDREGKVAFGAIGGREWDAPGIQDALRALI